MAPNRDRRADLLDVAAASFVEVGIRETTMESIAKGAGAGKATLYRYFPDKDGVVDALLERERQRAMRYARSALATAEGSRERLELAIAVTLGFLVEHPLLTGPHADEARELLDRITEPGSRHVVGLLETYSRLVRDGMADGTFRRVDPDAAAEGIVRLLLSYLAFPPMHLRVDDAGTREALARAVVAGLLA